MATEFNHNGNIYEIINDEEVRLTNLSDGCSGEVYIPKYAKYNDKRYVVTAIGNTRFQEYYEIKRKPYYRVIPTCCSMCPSVLYQPISRPLEKDLFPKNQKITSLVIPDTVTRIENGAFENCEELSELIIPESVTFIGVLAFGFCKKMTKLTLPKRLLEISYGAFKNCQNLKELTISNGVKIIKEAAFGKQNRGDYNDFLTHIAIPSSVEEIGELAFSIFRKLEQVDIYNEPSELMIAANAFPSTAKINYLGKKQEKEEAQKKTEFAAKTITETEVVEAKPAPKVKEESKAKVAKPVAKAGRIYSKIQVNYRFNGDTAEKKVKMTLTKKVLDYAAANGYDALEVAFDADRIVLRGGGNVLLQKVMDKALTITGYEWIE